MISKRIGHIALSIIMCMIAGSCGGDSKVIDEPRPDLEEGMVNLVLSVAVPDAVSPGASSRSVVTTPDNDNNFEGPATQYEKIHTLRVIIVSQNRNIVEHNKLFKFKENGLVFFDNMVFEVKENDKKTIYFFANEGSLKFPGNLNNTLNLDAIKAGASGDMAKAYEALMVKSGADGLLYDNESDTKSYIPMSETYKDIEVTDEYFQELPVMFITRAAVKFSFNIEPVTGLDMVIKSITFNKLAKQEYLLPNQTKYEPAYPLPSTNPLGGRFITEYKIPENTEHITYTFTTTEPIDLSNSQVKKWAPKLYFCESQYLNPDDNADDKEPYTLSIKVARKEEGSDGKPIFVDEYDYTALPLPNLPILPRNTHVIVNIKIGPSKDITCTVDLVPYTGVWLNPDFGVDRP